MIGLLYEVRESLSILEYSEEKRGQQIIVDAFLCYFFHLVEYDFILIV